MRRQSACSLSEVQWREYLFHVRNVDMPFYQHNRGEVPDYDKDAWLRMMKKIRETPEIMGQI